MRGAIILAGALLAVPAAAQAPAGLIMTCHPIYKGNDLGPQVYRVEGVELIKTDPSVRGPIIMSSAVKRQPLDRAVDKGVVSYSAAQHRVQGNILTRTVFWTDSAGKVLRTLRETYDFRAKTIRGIDGDLQRCR